MERLKIDGVNLRNMVINASNNLQEKKEFVNSLNVFPVPDGDTGTNMSMTFKSAVSEVENLKSNSISDVAKQVSRGALMGARGNSGVILSQIFRGIAKGLEGKDEVNALEFAKSLEEGAKYAYKAVMRPTEGTILTIIRAAGESATNANESDIIKLLEKVCKHTENVLNQTPDMLPALKEAKVVDAGGMGLFIILQGMYSALKDNIEANIVEEVNKTVKKPTTSAQATINPEDIKFGYCTEFFVNTNDAQIKAEDLKSVLSPVGDSMIVIGVDDIIKVHIHTNDPGFVLSNALKLGELSKIKIDNMREEHRQILDLEYATTEAEEESYDEINEETKEYGFVSVTMGNGLKRIFEDLGVDSVIEGGQTMNPSTQDIIERINKINAKNIFILPNNKNIIMAAEQACELSDKNVVVIPTKTIPQGITAITVFDANSSLEENIDSMKESIENVNTASVTYAVRDTEIDGKLIKEGNILGLIENKINEVGQDIYDVCHKLIDNMVDEDSELITVFYGKDCDEEKAQQFAEEIEQKYSDIDVQFYSGEQPLYYFIVAVE
ncbi:DAK2 domain-containing protein [Clostridium botulinum C]|uniref:DegV protein n=6 Tax=Clostridium TaxID=1485 RepID=A0A9P2LL49_CLOBO|nr:MULTISPECIES: DAK2 domain-containing protein [Clostridium]AYF54765.1 DAK2 domain-containing protein [Clostridium novyi]EES91031.1 DegV protein [Clostridium botulinum D str. 1873]KEI10354.1 dihydroxyacetone kinase [Clostridium sp. K25]KEI13601.1 dihydroxyacetone kinase [Clostridium novyi B str. NCTC 9691]KEI17078.1 dihydroxyacetone kinase [Clostridium haemolyticum NCTC 9693]